jgi:mRNA-degrading endonuclease HigB of HigAB toxin-antitoxin module
MRLIAISKLKEAASKYPDLANQINDFYEIIKKVQ